VRAWRNPEGPSPKALSVSIALKSDPALDEKWSGVGRREKVVSARVEKISIWQLPFCSDMFWRTHHTKSDPKIDVGDASLLMESIN
jgi:hypothetical protein